MTRQRTLILTRMEASDWGRQDALGRGCGDPRYWLFVLQLGAYFFPAGAFLSLARAFFSHFAQLEMPSLGD